METLLDPATAAKVRRSCRLSVRPNAAFSTAIQVSQESALPSAAPSRFGSRKAVVIVTKRAKYGLIRTNQSIFSGAGLLLRLRLARRKASTSPSAVALKTLKLANCPNSDRFARDLRGYSEPNRTTTLS